MHFNIILGFTRIFYGTYITIAGLISIPLSGIIDSVTNTFEGLQNNLNYHKDISNNKRISDYLIKEIEECFIKV